MIFEVSGLRVAVSDDVPDARFVAADRAVAELPTALRFAAAGRVAVEVHHRLGGHPQRALIGARLTPESAPRLRLEVAVAAQSPNAASASCPGSFDRSLVPGLPEEFVGAVLGGLLEVGGVAGLLMVDRAAHDPVESSSFAFRVAAGVVMELFRSGPDEAERHVTARLRALIR